MKFIELIKIIKITECQSSVTYVSMKFSFIKTLQYYTDCNILLNIKIVQNRVHSINISYH